MRAKIYRTVLKVSIIMVISALLVDQLFYRILIPAQDEFSNVKKMKRLIEQNNPEEVPIFGSSIAKRSYYPDSLGQTYFNYGMAGSVYVMLEPLLKIELEKDKQSPIIVDIEHHFFLSHKEIRMQLSNYIPYVDNEHIRNMLEERGLMRYQYDVPGLRLFGQYDDYLLDLMRLRFNRELTNKGGIFFKAKERDFLLFKERRQRLIDELSTLRSLEKEHPEMMSMEKKTKKELLDILLNFRPDSVYVQRFEKLLEAYPQRDVILVYSPQHEIKLMGLENHHELVATLQRIDSNHENLHVFDYSLEDFPDSHFHDSVHMSITGAYALSKLLRKDMEKTFPNQPELWTPKLLKQ